MTDTIARAFELAVSGKYHQLSELEKTLDSEGHLDVHGHFNGPLIRKQLMRLIKDTLPAKSMPPVQIK